MKRTNQIQTLINETNDYLRLNKITNTSDPVFVVVTNSLIHQNIYNGFQWKKRAFFTHNGQMFPMFVVCPEEEGVFIEIL